MDSESSSSGEINVFQGYERHFPALKAAGSGLLLLAKTFGLSEEEVEHPAGPLTSTPKVGGPVELEFLTDSCEEVLELLEKGESSKDSTKTLPVGKSQIPITSTSSVVTETTGLSDTGKKTPGLQVKKSKTITAQLVVDEPSSSWFPQVAEPPTLTFYGEQCQEIPRLFEARPSRAKRIATTVETTQKPKQGVAVTAPKRARNDPPRFFFKCPVPNYAGGSKQLAKAHFCRAPKHREGQAVQTNGTSTRAGKAKPKPESYYRETPRTLMPGPIGQKTSLQCSGGAEALKAQNILFL